MKRYLASAVLAVALLITGVAIPKLDGAAKEPAAFDVEFYVEN